MMTEIIVSAHSFSRNIREDYMSHISHIGHIFLRFEIRTPAIISVYFNNGL
jgi:hypothetical protein